MTTKFTIVVLAIGALFSTAAADWPQYLGPDRNAVSSETGLISTFPESGPEVLWTFPLGDGYGGPAVSRGKVYLLDRIGNDQDILRCIDLLSGKELWTFAYDAPGRLSYPGSRSVPAIDGNNVYTCGPFGHVHCIDITTHKPVWSANIWTDFTELKLPMWGIAQNPLIYRDMLIMATQSEKHAVIAFDKTTGKVRWKSNPVPHGNPNYATPKIVRILGEDQLIMLASRTFDPSEFRNSRRLRQTSSNTSTGTAEQEKEKVQGSIFALDPMTGKDLWEYKGWQSMAPIPNVTLAGEDRFLIAGAYRAGAELLKVEKTGQGYAVTKIFKNKDFGPYVHPAILFEGHFYAHCTDSKGGKIGMTCMDIQGNIKWKTEDSPLFDKGGFILADNRIYAVDGKEGDLYIVDPTPEGFKPLAKAKLLDTNKCWAPLTLTDGKLLIRDQEQMKCINISAKQKVVSVQESFNTAKTNADQANEGFKRADKFVRGWLALADAKTGLIPRNTKDMYWNAQDSAADNYPFMVLTASFTDESLFHGKMKDMLETEIKLTSRVDSLPDTYDFKTQKFKTDSPNINSIMFGSSEYIKDGLLPLTEWLGKSPWYDRMIAILDDMWKHAPVDTPFGKIVSNNVEVNGEMLQTLSRLYWMTGKEQYLEYAVRLGDYYLLGDHHPTNDLEHLRLRDHGCEIVSGLCELYATVNFAKPDKKKQYHKPIHQMLDRILEVGRNDDGMFYDGINPINGKVTSKRVADTWGYTYNGYYTVYMIDKTQRYLDETVRVLKNISKYTNYAWEGASSDGYADSIESAISLYNRLPISTVADWIDSETLVMWAKQKPTGVIEGWHGDGNFARTTIMYCLWKTQGISIHPWRQDVRIGAEQNGDMLNIYLAAHKPWNGRIKFDTPRHKTTMKLPIDWPRINHFPQWFTVTEGASYTLTNTADSSEKSCSYDQMVKGVAFKVKANTEYNLTLRKIENN